MASLHKNANFLLPCLSFSLLYTLFMCLSVSGIERPHVTVKFPDVGESDFQNDSVAVLTNSNPVFELHCNAHFPVEWVLHYGLEDDGNSELKKLATTYRHVSDFTNIPSYKFSAKLRLEYRGKILSLVNFTCRHGDGWTNFKSNQQTHVIMSKNNIASLISLEITYKHPVAPHSDLDADKNCSKAVATIGRVRGDVMPCSKCEVPETGKDLQLDFLRCLTPIQCASTYSRQRKGAECLRQVESRPWPCREELVKDFNPTILICKNYGPALAQFYFFGVFRGNRDDKIPGPPIYYDWTEVNAAKMLYMHPFQKKTLYTGQQVEFTCEYSRYFFSLGSWFGVKTNKGIEYRKAIDLKPCDTGAEKREGNCTSKEFWRGTYTGSLNMSFSDVGHHQVFCFGPVWNSTEWINASVAFYVEESKPPQIISLEPDKKKEFVIGQQNRKLVCKVDGKPVPHIRWMGPSNESLYRINQVDNFTSTITFIEIGHKTSGKYICNASSYRGSDHKFFQLTSHDADLSTTAIAAIAVTVIIIAAVITSVIVRMRKIIKSQQAAIRLLTEAELNEFVQGHPETLEAHKNDFLCKPLALEALPYDEQYEIPVENLAIEYSKILGSGEYGMVHKGTIRSASASLYVNLSDVNQSELEVAVKVSKGNLNVASFKALLTEVKVMAYLGVHRNIACLVGASTKNIRNRELYIAVEYCHNGSLDQFLKEHKSEFAESCEQGQFTIRDLLQWSMDIAEGIEYIHGKKIIHADLAIRNILLTKDLVAKVADFGLSRQLNESCSYTKSTKCALPWRNMAIESLKNLVFSAKSDMWAFGVTLWELFTMGDVPYPGMSYTIDFPNILERGLRLYKPPLASSSIYDYMLMCWSNEPNDRPGTSDLKIICLNEIN